FFAAEALQAGMTSEEGMEALRRVLDMPFSQVVVSTQALMPLLEYVREGHGGHEVDAPAPAAAGVDAAVVSPTSDATGTAATSASVSASPSPSLSQHMRPDL